MSGPCDESLLLEDIADCSLRLIELGAGVPADYTGGDRPLNEMILWNLVALGEAAKRLPSEIRDIVRAEFDAAEAERNR